VVLTGAAGPRIDSEGRTIAVAAPPVSQMVAVYTPAPGYHGTDSFQFVAVGIGGTSAPATVQINVEGSPPAARNLTANGIDNQTLSVDLTAGRTDGPFTNAAIVDIAPAGKASATIVAGGAEGARTYRMDIKPAAHFSGTLKLRYTLTNVFGVSEPATITVTVAARPDPSVDPTVRAIADAQSEAVRRFSRAQVDNFMRRAESLHDVECGGSTMGVTLNSTDRVNTQPLPGALPEQAELRADGRVNAAPETGARRSSGQQCGNSGLGFWAGGSVEIGTRDAVTGRDKISATTSGVSIGADLRLLPGLVVGIGGGFGHDSSTIDGGAGHVVSDSKTVVVYGSAVPMRGLFIDGMVARGWLDFDTRRLVAADAGTARGKRDGAFTTASLSAGTEQMSGLLRWSVYGRAEYLDGTLDAYRENGAGIYDLRFDDRDVRSVLGVAGFRLAWRGKLANGTITPSFRGEWLHEFADASSQALDYADVSGAAFYRFNAQGWGREQFALTPGLDLSLNSGWQFGFELGARIAEGERAATSRIQLRKQF
jgi:outer membrane autotransporter protein